MEKSPKTNHEKEMALMDLIGAKLTEQNKIVNKMLEITKILKDISTNIGKENASVMADIKYQAEFEEYMQEDKKLTKEIKDLEEKLRVFRLGK